MGFSVFRESARTACADSIEAFLDAADSFTEYELLGASRCHGWSRLEVVVHVLAGWQEMLAGLVSVVDDEPSVDAASYWPAFAAEYATEDPVPSVLFLRRRAASYARPSFAIHQLHEVAEALQRGVHTCADRRYLWQGHVFTAGDFLAVWAVENVVHQLDLLSAEPAPSSALVLARGTVEALVGGPLPETWSDLDATLIGTGRASPPVDAGPIAARLPVLA